MSTPSTARKKSNSPKAAPRTRSQRLLKVGKRVGALTLGALTLVSALLIRRRLDTR